MSSTQQQPVPRGHDDASLLSRSHVAWATRIIARGYNRALQSDDIPPAPKSLRAEAVFDPAEKSWAAARKRNPDQPKMVADVWVPLMRSEAPFIVIVASLSGLASTVGRTLFLRYVILSLDAASGYTTAQSFGFGGGLILMIWLENYARGLAQHWGGSMAPVRIAGAMKYLIARKALTAAVGSNSEGDETNLVGRDLSMLVQYAQMVPIVLGAVVQLVGGVVMLLVLVGPAALGGLGAMILLMVRYVSWHLTLNLTRTLTTQTLTLTLTHEPHARSAGHLPPRGLLCQGLHTGHVRGRRADSKHHQGDGRGRQGVQAATVGASLPGGDCDATRCRARAYTQGAARYGRLDGSRSLVARDCECGHLLPAVGD